MPKIPEYTALTAPSNADLLVIEDTIAGNTKKITRNDFLKGTPLPASTVDAQSIATNAVEASKIATNAITLASVSSSTSQTGITNTPVIVTGLTTNVTIPAGGRKVRVEAFVPWTQSTLACHAVLYIYESATVTGSPIQECWNLIAVANTKTSSYVFYEYTPSAGAKSYCAAVSVDAGSGATSLTAARLAYLTVKIV